MPDKELETRTELIVRTFTFPQRLLFWMSKSPADAFVKMGQATPTKQFETGNSLDVLRSKFPQFDSLVRDARVLDYGCGDGFQCFGLGSGLSKYVFGVDINTRRLMHARNLCKGLSNVAFGTAVPQDEKFDVAISLNAFEHFPEPEQNLRELRSALSPGGKLLLTFGPPWYAPYGSHMHFFTLVPWVNLLFSERSAHKVRSLYRNDGATTYAPNLNKMSIRKFERIVADSGFKVDWLKYHTVANAPLLDRIPLVRELFINRVTCVLVKTRS